MISLQDILKDRLEAYGKNPDLVDLFRKKGKEYQKSWNKGVQFFQLEINKDRKKENLPELPFISIRQKLLALKEIDDLRWFYYHCKKYANTKDKLGKRNSFSKCFFGALKIQHK
jgi:hypothetical protein